MVLDRVWQLNQDSKYSLVAVEKGVKDSLLQLVENNLTILNRKSDFDYLKKRGKRIYPSTWMIINYLPNQNGRTRCGWVISKKVGKAVLRNKFKRWCRDYFRRTLKEQNKSVDINVVLKEMPGKNGNSEFYKQLSFLEFKDSLENAWQKIK